MTSRNAGTSFQASLWSDSDPLYAPGKVQARNRFLWRAPARYIKAGYPIKSVMLPGFLGDDLDLERAGKCRSLTRDLVSWYEKKAESVQPGTWGWLMARYQSDEFSPIKAVKFTTRQSYVTMMGMMAPEIGPLALAETDYIALMRLKLAMENGFIQRREADNLDRAGKGLAQRPMDATDYIAKRFTMLRLLVSYGVLIGDREATRLQPILQTMRVATPAPRTQAMTRLEAAKVIEAADRAGWASFALSFAIAWETGLRHVDVRGQWDGPVWRDGLTWNMIAPDLSSLSKVPSKTAKRLPHPIVIDLTQLPDIQRRLSEIPKDQRVGPVIRQKDGNPFKSRRYIELFRQFANAAGVRADLRAMDSRAGAMTEATNAGARREDIQRLAHHARPETTDRYIRDDGNPAVNRVINLRQIAAR